MTRKRFKVALAAATAITAALVAAGCSSVQPSVGQYAIVTHHGFFSNQQVADVVAPGGHIKLNGATAWYLPAQFRNYVTNPPSRDKNVVPDRTDPRTVQTGPGPLVQGNQEPGMPVHVYTYVGWELNPAIVAKLPGGSYNLKFARDFLPFCLKYGCASQNAQNSNSNQYNLRVSDPGWLKMQDELMPTAIDDATQTAIKNFGPSLWTNQQYYPALGQAIGRQLLLELAKITSSPSGEDFFCGPSSSTTRCDPPLVQVNYVIPTDPGVVTAYNQKITAYYNGLAAQARFNAARTLYGADTNWALAIEDIEAHCPRICNVYVGNPPAHP